MHWADRTPGLHGPSLHPLLSARFGSLLDCFHQYGWPDSAYWPRASNLFWSSAIRTAFHRLESDPPAPESEPPPAPPLFIVGHWRSGTTHLHQLLSCDTQFAFVTFLQAGSPYDFSSPIIRALFTLLLPSRRPMDAVRIAPASPMEEEMAMASLGDLSFYHGFFFPRESRRIYRESVHFDGLSEERVGQWWRRYHCFLEKVRHTQPGKTLLLKNPANSARIAALRTQFPGARFIHLHRHPEKVLASTLFLHRRLREVWALQRSDATELAATVLANYSDLMSAIEAQTQRLPENEVIHVAAADLEANPVATVESIYRQLELPGFETALPRFTAYLREAAAFKPNQLTLTANEVASALSTLAHVYERWNYGSLPCSGGNAKRS